MNEQTLEDTQNLDRPDVVDTETPTVEAVDEPQLLNESDTEPLQTFDADYVKALRAEAAEYRVKAKRAEALARQALTAIVTADGRLIDPSDLHFTDDLIGKDGTLDGNAVRAAIETLIDVKPHLARKRPTAPIAQGVRPSKAEPNLLQIIQAGA
jgi:hypothetical protein